MISSADAVDCATGLGAGAGGASAIAFCSSYLFSCSAFALHIAASVLPSVHVADLTSLNYQVDLVFVLRT